MSGHIEAAEIVDWWSRLKTIVAFLLPLLFRCHSTKNITKIIRQQQSSPQFRSILDIAMATAKLHSLETVTSSLGGISIN